MSSEASFAEETADNLLKELQSWWEIPSTAQYISLFRECFNLPEIEIEELEKGFIDDTIKGPNEWLQNLIIAFLKSIMPGRVNDKNWDDQLRRLVRRKWPESPFSEKENPCTEDTPFHLLRLRSKVEIVYCFCLYRLDRNDTTELMKSMDADALRVQKLGCDEAGNTYWYFYGTRLYKEEGTEEKKPWDKEWKEQKRKSLKKKRGRGRPRKRPLTSDAESDVEGSDLNKSEFMNVNKKSRWSVVCDTIEEWVNFAEKFKNSKSKQEKCLFQIIQENFLPTLNKLYEEKEKKLQQKIRELMPVREKIVTRTETRRLRGENVDYSHFYQNGYDSDDYQRSYATANDRSRRVDTTHDRARRLEERNKRASEVEYIQTSCRKVKHDKSSNGSELDESSFLEKSDSQAVDLQSLKKLLTSVKLHKDAWPFLYPVSEDDAPGYYDIIKDPVDLSKIESRLFQGEYDSLLDLDKDFSKMVYNCELYNGESHAYSKMAQALWKTFRRGVAKIFDPPQIAETVNMECEESNDSQYPSSSSSSSPPHESPVVSSKSHKKMKEGSKKRKRGMKALDLLAQASDVAVQNSNSNDMLNISNLHDELKKCNDFPNLNILPIHSHPPSFIEKYTSSSSKESPRENDIGYETASSYLNEGSDNNGQYPRSSPTDSAISTSSASSETTNYMHNLSHLTNFIDKNVVKNLNLLSNSDVTNVLSESDSSAQESHNSSINEPSNFPQGAANSDNNIQGFDNILGEYPENFISHLMKQPAYNSENRLMSQSKDNTATSYTESLPKQDMDFNRSTRKSPNFVGHSVSENVSFLQDNVNMQYDLGSPSNNITTVDASILGISLNTLNRKRTTSSVPVAQNRANFSNNGNTVSNSVHEEVPSKSIHSYSPKQRTSPNEMSQYYGAPNLLNSDQTASVPSTSYQPLNLDLPSSVSCIQTTFVPAHATNSTSSMPLQVPAVYPKSIQQPINIQMQPGNNNVQVAMSQPNNHLMFVPESKKGQAVTYHVYTQNKPVQHVIQERINYHPIGSTGAIEMVPTKEKRINDNQDNGSRTSPPQKKSPVPQELQSTSYHVPSTNMPYIPASASTAEVSKTPSPVKSSSFVSVNSVLQAAKKNKPVFIKTKTPETEKRTSIQNVSTTSFNKTSTDSNNIVPQNNAYQSFSPKTVPVVIPGYNSVSSSNHLSELKVKNNPTTPVTMQSNVCIPNGVPIVQQVLLPAGSQQIQIPNNGQFVFASPQNTVRLFNKEQNVQIPNNVRQLNQNVVKTVPQISPASVIQVSKDGMQGLQFQALSPNNVQAFSQVAQSTQFINIPAYMLTNQNALNNSPPQSVMNLQPYQLSQRPMQISGQGNG